MRKNFNLRFCIATALPTPASLLLFGFTRLFTPPCVPQYLHPVFTTDTQTLPCPNLHSLISTQPDAGCSPKTISVASLPHHHRPKPALETSYAPEEQVRRFIIHPSTSPPVHLNEEALKDLYKQFVEDCGLPSYNQSSWSSNQATKSRAEVPSTGMMAFDDLKETPIAVSNKAMVLDKDKANSNISDRP